MARPVPVVNRALSAAVRAEERKRQARTKKQKTRLREIVGGGGLKLYFEEPERKLTPSELRNGIRLAKDPLVEESKKITQRRLRKERARELLEILFLHLPRYEVTARKRLVRVPNLQWSVKWAKELDEEQLMDALLSELCGSCRLHTVMRIHAELCRKRTARERGNLLDQFFQEKAVTKTFLRFHPTL